jgi:hypothetical protein
MIDLDLDLLPVYRLRLGSFGSNRDWEKVDSSLSMPLLGLWIARGAAEDQTRQCPKGSAIGAVASFDDLAYATRVRARSTPRSDDDSPRPSIRGFNRGSFETVLGCSAPRVRRAIQICTLARPNRKAVSLCFRQSPSTPEAPRRLAAFQRRPPVNVMR